MLCIKLLDSFNKIHLFIYSIDFNGGEKCYYFNK